MRGVSSVVEHLPYKEGVGGSKPSPRTIVFALAVLILFLGAGPVDLYRLVDDLYSTDAATRAAARQALIARNDVTIAPALVDSVFFNTAGRAETVRVLEHLLGESHGTAFKKWIEAIGRREDRKSTRLNSSHSQISYAVFCLKKKK